MIRLQVKEQAHGLSLTQLQTQLTIALGEPVYPATVRRYWYGTSDGRPDGPAIKMVDMRLLGAIARVLRVPVCDLILESMGEEPGQWEPAMMAA